MMGVLIGIIYGLYFKISIAFAFVFIILGYYIFLLLSISRQKNVLRYLRVFIKKNAIIIFCISAIVSNMYLTYLNNKYESFYKNAPEVINCKAIVISKKKEKEYSYSYIIKIKEGILKNKKFILSLKKSDENIINYGDLIYLEGKYSVPNTARNYKGFDYSNYLKSKKIYGTIIGSKIEIKKHEAINFIFLYSNIIRNTIEERIDRLLMQDSGNLLKGILIGNKEEIDEETIENFRNSNLSHILSVSGMHTSYLILRLNLYFKQK